MKHSEDYTHPLLSGVSSFVLCHPAAHDCCEVVSVTLCAVSRHVPGDPEDQKSSSGRVASLAEHRFSFVQDLAFDMAQFLVSKTALEAGFYESVCHCHMMEEEKSKWSPLLQRFRCRMVALDMLTRCHVSQPVFPKPETQGRISFNRKHHFFLMLCFCQHARIQNCAVL